MNYRSILESVRDTGILDHIHCEGRTVAIRQGYSFGRHPKPTGKLHLTFSDSRADLRASGDTIYNLTIKQAERAIRIFLLGQRVKIAHDQCDLFINQAFRWCCVDQKTPSRLRLSYNMPNAGTMGGWWKYFQIGPFHYVTNH